MYDNNANTSTEHPCHHDVSIYIYIEENVTHCASNIEQVCCDE